SHWQRVVLVLQKHDRFASGFKRELRVRRTGVFAVWNARVLHAFRWIEQTQSESRCKQPPQGSIEICFRNQTAANRGQQVFVLHAAVQIGSCLYGARRGLRRGWLELVTSIDVVDRSAIGNHVALEIPFLAQNIAEQSSIPARWLSIDAVIGA